MTWTVFAILAMFFKLPLSDVPGESLVQLVDEHEHVAVLFYSSLDKNTKKVYKMFPILFSYEKLVGNVYRETQCLCISCVYMYISQFSMLW